MRKGLENILLEVSKSPVIDSGELQAAIEVILTAVLEGLQVDRASVWVLSNDSMAITCELLIDKRTGKSSSGLVITQREFPNYFEALLGDRAIVAHDVYSHPDTAEFGEPYCRPLNIQAMLDAPLRHRGDMVGILCCEHVGNNRLWQTDEVTFACAMADLYGRVLSATERARFQHQLQQQNDKLEQLVAERTESLEKALANFEYAQERLIETEKMAALGKLVAGVAHEVNTPLGIAVTAISHSQHQLNKLKARLDAGSLSRKGMASFMNETQQAYDLLNSNIERAALLIQNFKRTAVDQSSFELVDCYICDYLKTLMFSLRPLIKEQQVNVVIDCNEDIFIKTYQGAIAQIITNLLSNSCTHAFTDPEASNTITITGTETDTGIMLTFADNGSGMDRITRKQIFDPFYTTARHNGGSGLGLYIVYNLVTQKLKGSISVTTAPQQGTEFTLHLPDLNQHL
ncbi:MAG: GAF domain-containing sensor histidine kinase [Idiomarina sp.]